MNRCGSLLLGIGLALITGCGGTHRDPPGIVTGRVTNNTKPVTDANIYFEKVGDDYAVFESLRADGTFQIKTHDLGGLPAGSYRIAVRPDPGKAARLVGDAPDQLSHPLIPAACMNAQTSGLTVEVRVGENPSFDFDLGKINVGND